MIQLITNITIRVLIDGIFMVIQFVSDPLDDGIIKQLGIPYVFFELGSVL